MNNARKSLRVPPSSPLTTSHSFRVCFNTNLNRISATLGLHTALKPVTHRSKPWWPTTLAPLRMAYNSTLRMAKSDGHKSSLLMSVRAAYSAYFNVIKNAKRDNWCEFLTTATPQTVWAVKTFTMGRPPPRFLELLGPSTPLELNIALHDHLFPRSLVDEPHTILLPYKHAMTQAPSDIESALAPSFPS